MGWAGVSGGLSPFVSLHAGCCRFMHLIHWYQLAPDMKWRTDGRSVVTLRVGDPEMVWLPTEKTEAAGGHSWKVLEARERDAPTFNPFSANA